jgi:hypothetical protein
VGNATEETFRNQDTINVGRSAANATGSSRPFFAPRFLPSDPIALRFAPQNRGVLSGPLLKRTSRRKPRRAHSLRRAMGTGRQSSKKKP